MFSYYICSETQNLVSSESVHMIQYVNVTVFVLRVNEVDFLGGCMVSSGFQQ